MNKNQLSRAIDHIDSDLIDDHFLRKEKRASSSTTSRTKAYRRRWVVALAALLCIALLIASFPIILRISEQSKLPLPNCLNASDKLLGLPEKSAGKIPSYLPNAAVEETRHFYWSRWGVIFAKAIEVLPDSYTPLGSTQSYRIFRMELIDSFKWELRDEFFYAVPEEDFCDLTRFDSLLMRIYPMSSNVFVNNSTKELSDFSTAFYDDLDEAKYLHVVPFTDGKLDESPWQDGGEWYDVSKWVNTCLEDSVHYEIYRGISYEQAYANIKAGVDSKDSDYFFHSVYNFTSSEALEALEFIKPFKNGVFKCEWHSPSALSAVRYINGCPTNEIIYISKNGEKETVRHYGAKFTEEDMSKLFNVSEYIERLDLSLLKPQNINLDRIAGVKLAGCRAFGWYEKTDDGVESMIRISWHYYTGNENQPNGIYVDDLYIRLTEDGAKLLTRKQAKALLKDSKYILRNDYNSSLPIVYY